MNEKLTTKQRDWILDKLKEVSLELQDGNVSWTSVNIHRFEQALNAHTTEDEGHDCIKHLRQLGWNVTEPAEYDGLTGKYLKGDLSKANPVAIKPKTEDEPSRIKDYDGYIFSIDKLPRKIANHITLRKIWEFRDKNNDNPLVRLVCNLMEIWLQQEDK